MFSDKLPSPLSAPLLRFLPVLVSVSVYCTMHPSGSRFSIFIALVKMSRSIGVPKNLRSLFSARFHESPLSATADPENDRFQAVSKGRRQLSWFLGASISMAHGVVSQDGNLGSKRGWNRSPISFNGWTSEKTGSLFQPAT